MEDELAPWIDKLYIDLNNLHEECSRQPVNYARLGVLVSHLRAEAKAAKDRYYGKRAELAIGVRSGKVLFEAGRITDAAIESFLDAEEGVRAAKQEMIDAEERADAAGIVLDAFDQRRTMLKAEVDLWVGRYFGEGQMSDAVNMSRVAASRGKP